MVWIIATMVLAGIGFIIAGFFEKQQEAPETNIARRVSRVANTPLAGATMPGRLPSDAQREVDRQFAKEEENRARAERRRTTFLPTFSKYTDAYHWLGRLENDLLQVRSPWRATEVFAASAFLGLLLLVVGLWMRLGFFSFGLALLPLLLPRLYIKMLRAAYFRKFDDQLADALLLMSNSLRAGFSFMQSMEMVAREAPSPICDEFHRVTQEISIGVPIGEALTSMTERVKSVDLALVVTAVIIQREVGGALAQLLELIASVIRERQRIKGEIRTLTAQGRLTGAILGAMPITVGLAIILVGRISQPGEPSFIEPLIATQLGHMILAGAFFWQILGVLIINKIVSIKV
ncbi:tight adherence protein B [Abditibacterium utsteinense]|uniref:Tight adherence protein B n=1 Tax=Abditibacterium utsteinense TaxID=1960156 RepID=A0A2S8SSW8_9BACT|nr:type II secretion system F family protein [Abditibacterium utsteinense]PQV63885.1 tight adherence protein B [Abditibacterium utsteinense]